jgi:hypothetical protein
VLGQEWSVALNESRGKGGMTVRFDGLGTKDGTYHLLKAADLYCAPSRDQTSYIRLTIAASVYPTVLGEARPRGAQRETARCHQVSAPVGIEVTNSSSLPTNHSPGDRALKTLQER